MTEPRENRGPEAPAVDWVCAGTVEELKARGMAVVRGGNRPLLVVMIEAGSSHSTTGARISVSRCTVALSKMEY